MGHPGQISLGLAVTPNDRLQDTEVPVTSYGPGQTGVN